MAACEAHLAGLALAGGRARRFGGDKALAPLAGRPMLGWTVAALDRVCEAVAVSAAAGSPAAALAASPHRPVLFDDPAHGAGPLAGIAAGLAWAAAGGFAALATLPCDTPLVGAGELECLIATLSEAPAVYAVSPRGPQPLCAVWRSGLAGDLAAALAGGRHPPVRDFLAAIGARPVPFADPRPFANVNRREDLDRLAAELAGAGPSTTPFN